MHVFEGRPPPDVTGRPDLAVADYRALAHSHRSGEPGPGELSSLRSDVPTGCPGADDTSGKGTGRLGEKPGVRGENIGHSAGVDPPPFECRPTHRPSPIDEVLDRVGDFVLTAGRRGDRLHGIGNGRLESVDPDYRQIGTGIGWLLDERSHPTPVVDLHDSVTAGVVDLVNHHSHLGTAREVLVDEMRRAASEQAVAQVEQGRRAVEERDGQTVGGREAVGLGLDDHLASKSVIVSPQHLSDRTPRLRARDNHRLGDTTLGDIGEDMAENRPAGNRYQLLRNRIGQWAKSGPTATGKDDGFQDPALLMLVCNPNPLSTASASVSQ